ncbi:MAG: trehalose-phosphatase [Burkholderiales bacterium]|nr:trehalose-phosphatase [Burkholderiales bacterium]
MSMRPAPLTRAHALFLDVDGTLLPIVARPQDVRVDAALRGLLTRLHAALDGALALVSGRSIAEIDQLFQPLVLPLAGQHGYERRDASLRLHRADALRQPLDEAAAALNDLSARHRGLLVEKKGASVALHYRLAPQLAEMARTQMKMLEERLAPEYELMAGKMVFELKPAQTDKGTAIRAFMHEAPFAGRVPVFLGDDATDEHGFAAVDALGGEAIKIGLGASCARWRLGGASDVRSWLNAALDALRVSADRRGR